MADVLLALRVLELRDNPLDDAASPHELAEQHGPVRQAYAAPPGPRSCRTIGHPLGAPFEAQGLAETGGARPQSFTHGVLRTLF